MYGHEYLKDFFRRQNFTYEEKEERYIFSVQGTRFHAFKNESPYLQIFQLWNKPEGASRSTLLEAANAINNNRFVVKITIDNDDDIWVSYEFRPNSETSDKEWMSIFDSLSKTAQEFHNECKKH